MEYAVNKHTVYQTNEEVESLSNLKADCQSVLLTNAGALWSSNCMIDDMLIKWHW